MSRRLPLPFFVLVGALTSSCLLPFELEGRFCESDLDCIDGYFCSAQVCVSTESGGGFESCDPTALPGADCDGDVEGEWLVRSSCVDDDTTFPRPDTQGLEGCPGATLTAVGSTVGGDTGFDDGSGNLDLDGEVSWRLDVPAICTGGTPCNVFQLGVGDGSATCTDDGAGGCTCLGLVEEYERFEPVLEYTLSGDQLSTSGEANHRFTVCKKAGTMMIAETVGGDTGPTILLGR